MQSKNFTVPVDLCKLFQKSNISPNIYLQRKAVALKVGGVDTCPSFLNFS